MEDLEKLLEGIWSRGSQTVFPKGLGLHGRRLNLRGSRGL